MQSTSEDCLPKFSIRIVVVDHYMAKPIPGIDVVYSEFRGSGIKQVPILRVFGPASDGYKACIHVHGVFPYFYIPCNEPSPQPQLLYQIAASLDKALNISMKQTNSTDQHVYCIKLVKGLPFYGFHYKEHLFLKVFLYNPGLIKQAVELLQNGAVLSQVFQPYEAHLNFHLQFFIDFNLFGMINMQLQAVIFRLEHDNEEISDMKRYSMCHYEGDCLASHIINRLKVHKGNGIENPGLEAVWNEEMERRKALNASLAFKSKLTPRNDDMGTESHHKFEKRFWLKMSKLVENPISVLQSDANNTKSFEASSYPAEYPEDSQVLDATNVTFHQPTHSNESMTFIEREVFDDTVIDEAACLNCSLTQGSTQLSLDTDDLDFVEMLKDMDQQVDGDSILGTQAEVPKSETEVDADQEMDYSQVFHDDTLQALNLDEKEDTGDKTISPDWEDSFWGSSKNISQLDGADDEECHSVKGAGRKKLKRTRSLGLVSKRLTITPIIKSLDLKCDRQSEGSCSTLITENQQEQTDSEEFVTKYIENNEENYSHNASFFLKMTPEFLDTLQCSAAKKQPDKHSTLKMSSESNSKHKGEENYMNEELVMKSAVSNNKWESLHSSPDSDNKSFSRDGIKSFYDISNVFDATIDRHNNTVVKIESVHNDGPKLDQQPNATPEIVENMDDSTVIKLRHTDTLAMKSPLLSSNSLNNASSSKKLVLTPKVIPPSKHDVCSTLNLYNILEKNNLQPYYSNYKDVGSRIEVGQMILKMSSRNVIHLKTFDKILDSSLSIEEWQRQIFTGLHGSDLEVISGRTLNSMLACNKKTILGPLKDPPSKKEVEDWVKAKMNSKSEKGTCEVKVKIIDEDMPQDMESYESTSNASQVINESKGTDASFHQSMYTDGSFLCYGSNSESTLIETSTADHDFLTIMAIEVNTHVRGELRPDPEFDSINSIFYIVTNDCPEKHFLPKEICASIVVADQPSSLKFDRCAKEVKVEYVGSELDLIYKFLQEIKKWDPDILCGYEIEMNSWGYLLERAQYLGLEILHEVSRITTVKKAIRKVENNNYEGKITGRVIFGVWRLLRYELALSSYSFEATMLAVLKERVPSYSPKTLAEWWEKPTHLLRWMTVEYYMSRLCGTIRMLEKLDFINRTSELARLFGIQWWEVLSRGSQYRVESLMLRAAHPLNLIALSPSVKQRSTMKAPEILPLIFEPESRFYADPVIVLDFQSLYPSMMIAYNYCFSTCLGKVQNINGDAAYELGAWRLRVPGEKLRKLVKSGLVHWSPVGSGFVTSDVRRGVLPALLRRILAARQAVKANAKFQTDENVKKAMHSRQLGLKLIANVTYGYTAANFSGRMPCVEVADSVVAKGRETLERAIKLVENNKEWNAKVVYGDTDSMFVMVPGGTREQAFHIGAEIAAAVTADNPSPVTLKLEKVYQPCILQTKKRYVGYMYETPETTSPVYEAKGIETVRRDGCPAGVELLTQSLCELFSSGDVSKVKQRVCSVLSRLLDCRLPPLELAFTREYHGPTGYRPGAAAPPLELARRLQKRDRRSAPRVSERVSWVICWGAPGQPLVKLARSPSELRAEPQLRPHSTYYATRVLLPPLARCFSLIGVDVFQWYSEIPRRPELGVGGIVQYMWRESCVACGRRSVRCICPICATEPGTTVHAIMNILQNTSQQHSSCGQICSSCTGHRYYTECTALECPMLWRRQSAAIQLQQATEAVGNISLTW